MANAGGAGASGSSSSSSSNTEQKDSKWYFTAEQLANSPSRRYNIDADKELSYRQLTAYLIQDMGQRLQVSQLCINTAIVYMHRFYAFHSFTHFHRNGIAAASLFLAAKVEEQPRKLEHVIKVASLCLSQELPQASSELYAEQAQDLVFNENVLLQTLGFDVGIDHPHTHVVKTCHLVKASKDLAQTSYFLASNSLHLTSMCLQYRPTVVACFCIYLACKWSRWEIPQSTEGKHWFQYVDKSVTLDLLEQLTNEFLVIYDKSPARLKSKLNSIKALAQGARINDVPRPIAESPNGSSSQMPQLEARRPENYSSHHRSHHSSSHSGSHHHHTKSIPTNELGEHGKSPSSSMAHKQSYSGSVSSHSSSRSKPDRGLQPAISDSQHNNAPSYNSSKQILPPPSSRSSSSNRPPHGMPGVNLPSSQRGTHGHDPNYHKSRSGMPPQMSGSHSLGGHKVKGADQRHLAKEASGRPIDSSKSSIKYPSQNPSNVSLDRSNPLQQPPTSVPSANYNQSQNYNQSARNVSSSSSMKFDQSVHQQQQQQLQPPQQQQQHSSQLSQQQQLQMQQQQSQKQSIESSYNSTNLNRHPDDILKASGNQMEICSPTKFAYPQVNPHTLSSLQMQDAPLPSQQIAPLSLSSKQSSIFSPEWNEKPSNMSNLMNPIVGSNGNSNKQSSMKSSRDKQSQFEKRSSKNIMENPAMSGGMGPDESKFFPTALNLSGAKRLAPGHDMPGVLLKTEDDYIRESKMRRIESPPPSKMIDQKPPLHLFESLSNDQKHHKSFSTVNGIETNPDLVSSLLKESLCNDSKFTAQALIKAEPIERLVDNVKPMDMELEKPKIVTVVPPLSSEMSYEAAPAKEEPAGSQPNDYMKLKSEKKKKKDKHKHKEKDKSKEKEEKKKHKKDKDKHKERDRLSGNESELNPVKIKISKDKVTMPPIEISNQPMSGFKIKIPKDRLLVAFSDESKNMPPPGKQQPQQMHSQQHQQQMQQQQQSLPPPPSTNSLKIKISKDKIENYNSSKHSKSSAPYTTTSGSTGGGGGGLSAFEGHSSSGSSKKKDRDRDRDKDRKRHANTSGGVDFNKQNGSGNAGSSGAGIGGGSAGGQSTGDKGQSSSNSSKNVLSWLAMAGNIDSINHPPNTYTNNNINQNVLLSNQNTGGNSNITVNHQFMYTNPYFDGFSQIEIHPDEINANLNLQNLYNFYNLMRQS